MRTKQQVAEIIAELCGKVALLFPQNEIEAILFGSYARGDAQTLMCCSSWTLPGKISRLETGR